MSDDTQCIAVVSGITYKPGNIPSILHIEDGCGAQSIKEFKFPSHWHDYHNWNAIKRGNFKRLLQKGELINIIFDKDHNLLELSSTNEDMPQEYFILHDPLTYSSISINPNTTNTTTTTTNTNQTDFRRNREKSRLIDTINEDWFGFEDEKMPSLSSGVKTPVFKTSTA